jgi:hypothetical protein
VFGILLNNVLAIKQDSSEISGFWSDAILKGTWDLFHADDIAYAYLKASDHSLDT